MQDAWVVVRGYANETEELRNEIRALKKVIDSCNAAYSKLSERYVQQEKLLARFNDMMDNIFGRFGEID